MLHDICHWISEQDSIVRNAPPAFQTLGAAERLRKSIPHQKLVQAPAYLSRQVKKYSRLLFLEECAMEDQIRR